MLNSCDFLLHTRLAEVAVEGDESAQAEDAVVLLLLDLAAPVPRAGESTVDAGSGVDEVVGA